jgi:hypothetical protein
MERFKENQFVKTTKEIKFWGKYLLRNPISLNRKGKIKKIISFGSTSDSCIYEVEFDREFATFQLKHSDLKAADYVI